MTNNSQAKVVMAARGISKFFTEPVRFQVLTEVSIDVYRGELLTLVGKSGSGKSTLLYCLSTMDTDYKGQLEVLGQPATGRSGDELARIRLAHIGFVFQFHYLLPEFTCLENVMLPALRLGQRAEDDIRERALHRLEQLDLREQANKQAAKLSGGQQQRVAIARALINNPDILLCDEPTGNLDSKNSTIVLDIFKQIAHEENRTVLAVTHDMDFAAQSDRTIELADGKVVRAEA